MTQLLERFNLESMFRRFIASHPVWGTCAGMILLSRGVNDNSIAPYGVIDIAVDRNGYGRQVFSKVVSSRLSLNGHREDLELVFIRAPRVTRTGEGVETLLTCEDDPVLMAQGHVLVSSFHPELTRSTILHDFFARRFPVV
jgi:5'-phosphate synthase pdxT subunit